MDPRYNATDPHEIREKEAWVECDSSYMVQEHLSVVILLFSEKQQLEKTVNMVPVSEENVKFKPIRQFREVRVEAFLDTCAWMGTT